MTDYLLKFKTWYELRDTRERVLVILLGWALLYAVFYFILFKPLEYQHTRVQEELKVSQEQVEAWQLQVDALKRIASTPLYKKWLTQNRSFRNLQEQYHYLLQTSQSKQWQDVIKTLLQSQPNIRLDLITNYPEAVYKPKNIDDINKHILQQRLVLTFFSDYYSTVSYLQKLEQTLPNIHWDNLDYQVTNYPTAKVNMEFSILYEK